MDRNSASLFLSVIAVAEVEDGIAKARRQGATRKAEKLSEWLEALLHLYSDRIISVDLKVARHMGPLADLARGEGHDPGLADVAIAATALHHGYTILTRNLRHFVPLGVPALNPYSALPADCG